MKFLLDVNMPPSLGECLKTLNHTYRWVPNCMSPMSTDTRILEEATETGEVILTHDTDFGTLLSFLNTKKPSVILFRINKINTARFFALLKDNWPIINQPLIEGALVIFEDDKIRIRELPINRKSSI